MNILDFSDWRDYAPDHWSMVVYQYYLRKDTVEFHVYVDMRLTDFTADGMEDGKYKDIVDPPLRLDWELNGAAVRNNPEAFTTEKVVEMMESQIQADMADGIPGVRNLRRRDA